MFQSTRPARGATRLHRRICARGRFQSTRPARGATSASAPSRSSWSRFNPRAPHGARRSLFSCLFTVNVFQSTRPARGATMPKCKTADERAKFQSTRPARGATGAAGGPPAPRLVSIHAPRTGRDQSARVSEVAWACFNPRAPHGARRSACPVARIVVTGFNPRAPHGARHHRDSHR